MRIKEGVGKNHKNIIGRRSVDVARPEQRLEATCGHSLVVERLKQRHGLRLVVTQHLGKERRATFDNREVLVWVETGLARHDAHILLGGAAQGVDADDLALEVRNTVDAAVGLYESRVVIIAIHSKRQELMDNRHRDV